jgi:hypothetical protein
MSAETAKFDERTRETCAARLVYAWSRCGLSARELAERSNMPYTTLHRYLTGERFPSAWALMGLCPVLHVSSDWVLGIPEQGRGLPPVGSRVYPGQVD